MEGGGDGVQAVACLGEFGGGRGWDVSPAWAPSSPAQAALGRPGRLLGGPGRAPRPWGGPRGLRWRLRGPRGRRWRPWWPLRARPPGRSWSPALGLEAELGGRGRRAGPELASWASAPRRFAPRGTAGRLWPPAPGPQPHGSPRGLRRAASRPGAAPRPARGAPKRRVTLRVYPVESAACWGILAVASVVDRDATRSRPAAARRCRKGGCPSRRCRPPSLAGGRPSTNAGKGGRGRHVVGPAPAAGCLTGPDGLFPIAGRPAAG